jgi:predicted ATPase/class 3 adenylate cyclase
MTTGIVTFLFTDIEGSTALLTRLGDAGYSAVLEDHHRIIRSSLQGFGGVEHGTQGDSFFAVFASPMACVTAALEMQRDLRNHDWPAGEQLRVRMGIHTGEATEASTGMVGYEVHRAARIAAVGYGGQVLVSSSTMALVGDSLPPGTSVLDLGSHRLKDLGRPEVIFQLVAEDLDEQFPPLRSLDSPALLSNLPVQLTSFVGRDHELNQVRTLVEESRLVTLTGAGGSGKTRLALQVAAELLDGSGDGVWFVDLAPLADPDLVAESMATAIGVREEPGRPVAETLIDALRESRLLVVLDNCEHLIDTCAKLTDAILRGCPGVNVLATSREPLGLDGEAVFRVPSLSLPPAGTTTLDQSEALGFEAVQLFVDRARSHILDFTLDDTNAAQVVSLCGQLDGIPLAIELAAARLRSLSVADIEGHLGDRFRLLTGGSRIALPRQQTLRALIDWSYELFNYRDRDVFDRLAVFAGTFDLHAAQEVCATENVESFEVIDAISSLVDKSMVQADPSENTVRYRLFETIRQYAAERLGEDQERMDSTNARHAEVFLALAEVGASHLHGPDQAEWLARLETEHGNLRAAMAYLLGEHDRSDKALRLGVALQWFWYRRGYLSEGLNQLSEAFERLGPNEANMLRARGLAALGELHLARGGVSSARACVEEGLQIARELGDPALTVDFLDSSAWINFQDGDYTTASGLIDEAVALARQEGGAWNVARTLSHRGVIIVSYDPDRARVDLGEALSISRKIGDQHYLEFSLMHLGDLELLLENVDEGRVYLEECVSISRGHDPSQASLLLSEALDSLGLAAIMQGDVANALGHYDESFRLAQETGSPLFSNMLGLALCLSVIGELDQATRLHGAADGLLENGQSWAKLGDKLRERDHARLRRAMGEKPFEAAYSAGRRLTSSEAVALAQQSIQRLLAATSDVSPNVR